MTVCELTIIDFDNCGSTRAHPLFFFVLTIRCRPPRAIIHLRYDDPDLASGILFGGTLRSGPGSLVGGEPAPIV